MPIFEVQGPDGKTYEADAPDMASAAAAFSPKQPQQQQQKPPQSGPLANAFGFLEPAAHFISGMVAKPVSDIMGTAAAAHDALTGNQNGDPEGFKQDIQSALTYQPRTETGQGITAAVGAVMKPIAAYTNWAGDFYSNGLKAVGAPQWLVDAVKAGETEAAGQALNFAGELPGQAVNAAKAAVRSALLNLESKAAPRVRSALADAQSVAPDLQTVAQTTASPFLGNLGRGAAGSKTAAASADIVDKLSAGMTDQAKRLAPLGVSNPDVAAAVQKAIQAKDAELGQRGDAVYTSGRAAVAKDPTQVSTFNTVNALDQMMAEVNDPKVLAPPVVTERLQKMIDTLRGKPAVSAPPGSGLATAPPVAPGTNWAGFYDLRKQINTLYDTVPKDQITPALDQTFARLKAAYYQDLGAAPAGPAKTTTVKANEIYQGIADEREVLKNSVAAAVLGKNGKTALADPDAVMQRLYALKDKPAALGYVRDILETYSPQTLDAVRSSVITQNVENAGRGTAPATVSGTNAAKLSPGELADSNLFTPEQQKELRARQSALNTALTALPEKGAAQPEIDPQSVSRLVGGGFNPVFTAGALGRVLTAGKLEKYLNTPEGRNAILAKPKDGPTAGPTKMFIAAVLARVAQERNASQQGQQQQPQPGAPPPQQ